MAGQWDNIDPGIDIHLYREAYEASAMWAHENINVVAN